MHGWVDGWMAGKELSQVKKVPEECSVLPPWWQWGHTCGFFLMLGCGTLIKGSGEGAPLHSGKLWPEETEEPLCGLPLASVNIFHLRHYPAGSCMLSHLDITAI